MIKKKQKNDINFEDFFSEELIDEMENDDVYAAS